MTENQAKNNNKKTWQVNWTEQAHVVILNNKNFKPLLRLLQLFFYYISSSIII